MNNKKEIKPIHIDPEHGFYPHFTTEFNEAYGWESAFVFAAADALTGRFIKVLINAGRIDRDTIPLRLGNPAAVDALEELLTILRTKQPASEDIKYLLREATGVTPVGSFSKEIDSVFGSGTFEAWLSLFQAQDFRQALSMLKKSNK
jgi:hypothetical protein